MKHMLKTFNPTKTRHLAKDYTINEYFSKKWFGVDSQLLIMQLEKSFKPKFRYGYCMRFGNYASNHRLKLVIDYNGLVKEVWDVILFA